MNMAGGYMLKFTFYFTEGTHEPLHLESDKLSFVHWKIMDVPRSFIWIIIFFDGAFEWGGISNLRGYVGTNAEVRCLEL
jgi:hypothetical protein